MFYLGRVYIMLFETSAKKRQNCWLNCWYFLWHNIMGPRAANNESSDVIDILLPETIYCNASTRLDNVKNL